MGSTGGLLLLFNFLSMNVNYNYLDEIVKQMPGLGGSAKTSDPIVWVRFYSSDNHYNWYGIEHIDHGFLGLIFRGNGPVLFDLKSLKEAEEESDFEVIHDSNFMPCQLSAVRKHHNPNW